MWKSGFLLIGLLSLFSSLSGSSLRTWHGIPDESLARLSPASAGMAAVSGLRPGDYDTGGLRDESYLAVPRGPEWLSDMDRIDSVARQHQVMAVVVEPETETQTRATHYYGEGAWEREAPRTGNRFLAQPSTRGEATYYHPSLAGRLMRNGRDRYDPEDPTIAAVAIVPDSQGMGRVPTVGMGTILEVCHEERCLELKAQDTGLFPPHHLDLSEAAWLALAGGKPLSVGRLEISWRVIDD